MAGKCVDCGRQSLVCGTCEACVKCHPEGLEFCIIWPDETTCEEHFVRVGNDLVPMSSVEPGYH